MIEPLRKAELIVQLQQFLMESDLANAPRKAGERLLRRLTSDISVVLAGPEADAKDYLFDVLTQSGLPQTTVSTVPWLGPLDFTQADVCIWCSSGFETEEAAQWHMAPDRLKDHSFLVVFSQTMLYDSALDQAALDRLGSIAEEEFYSLSHITFGNRATALQPASVRALAQEVAKKVSMGLAADADNAQLFIKTYRGKEAVLPADSPAVAQKSTPAYVIPEPLFNAEPQTTATVYQDVLGAMGGHIIELKPFLDIQDAAACHKVLSICEATMTAAVDVLEDCDLQDADLALLKDEALSATDTIVLMALEGGIAPAVSAVRTVLQMRRELEMQVAC